MPLGFCGETESQGRRNGGKILWVISPMAAKLAPQCPWCCHESRRKKAPECSGILGGGTKKVEWHLVSDILSKALRALKADLNREETEMGLR